MHFNEFFVNFVLNSAWQIAAIFVVALLVSWLLRNGPARYRHTLWLVVMIASLAAPIMTTTRFVPAVVSSFQITAPPAPLVTNAAETSQVSSFEDLEFDHTGTSRRKTLNLWPRDIALLAFLYAVFFSARSARLARFWLLQRQLRQSVTDLVLPSEIEAAGRRCRSLLSTSAAIALSKQTRVPATIGVLRPLIILPENFCV